MIFKSWQCCECQEVVDSRLVVQHLRQTGINFEHAVQTGAKDIVACSCVDIAAVVTPNCQISAA